MRADADDQGIARPGTLNTLDKLFVGASCMPAIGALIGLVLAPSWQLALAVLLLALIPWCVLTALRRRRQARSLMEHGAGSPDVGRTAARLHLQEMGFVLLALVLLFAAGGAMAARG